MTNPTPSTLTASTYHTARKVWTTAFFRGAVFLVVGLIMFFSPHAGTNLVRWLLVVLFAAQAVLLAVEAIRLSSADRGGVSWRALLAAVAAAAAVALIVWPHETLGIALRLVAVWALISGVVGLVSALRALRARHPRWDWELTTAVLWLLFGVLGLAKRLDDETVVAAALSVYLTVSGAVLLVAGLQLRIVRKDAAAGEAVTVGGSEATTSPIPPVGPVEQSS